MFAISKLLAGGPLQVGSQLMDQPSQAAAAAPLPAPAGEEATPPAGGAAPGLPPHGRPLPAAAAAAQKLAAGPQGSTQPATPSGRAAPAGFAYHQGTSQFKGVSWSERSRKWRAQLWFGAKVCALPSQAANLLGCFALRR